MLERVIVRAASRAGQFEVTARIFAAAKPRRKHGSRRLRRKEHTSMKKVEAIVRPHKLDEIKDALGEIGVKGMTVGEAAALGLDLPAQEVYRGSVLAQNLVPYARIELIVPDALLPQVMSVIMRSADARKSDDGTLLVTDIYEAYRIRTGERGDAAV
jgi:nitrogen regulatory protein PII